MQQQNIITMKRITKRFRDVTANDAVDFELFPGEVHTLLGENGAGKSTLMHILAGMVQPDSGSLEIRGKPTRITSPLDALKVGIGMVYQHFALVPGLTVLENIVLGFEGGRALNRRRSEKAINLILAELELSLPLYETIENLSVGQQQRVEIIKALYHKSDVLILDEPTSVLSPMESEALFQTILSLRESGKSIVFITHKLKEALRISDRISILKLGRKVDELSGETLREMGETEGYKRIFNVMFEANDLSGESPERKQIGNEPVLELEDISCLGNRGEVRLKKISFTLKSGEVFGIAGVDGNGQKELAETIAGQRRAYSGRLALNGEDITHTRGTDARMALGISYITDDRMQEGCALSLSIAENAILRVFNKPPFSRNKILNKQAIHRQTRSLIEEYNMRVDDVNAPVITLSGGNIQKLLLARELFQKPVLLVCNNPTHGLDAQTAQYIQRRLQEECERGAAVLLISSDLDELLNYTDRIGVLYDGEIMDILDAGEATHERIGRLMLGFKDTSMTDLQSNDTN